jgi:hypothetical protein
LRNIKKRRTPKRSLSSLLGADLAGVITAFIFAFIFPLPVFIGQISG